VNTTKLLWVLVTMDPGEKWTSEFRGANGVFETLQSGSKVGPHTRYLGTGQKRGEPILKSSRAKREQESAGEIVGGLKCVGWVRPYKNGAFCVTNGMREVGDRNKKLTQEAARRTKLHFVQSNGYSKQAAEG